MEEEKTIFRKKSLESISSPEKLDDYIRVTNPGVWMLLGAIIILLLGTLAWAAFGSLEETAACAVIADDGVLTCYMTLDTYQRIDSDSTIKIDNTEYAITDMSCDPVKLSEDENGYICSLLSVSDGDWVYSVKSEGDLEDGIYSASIVVGSITPLKFIVN